MSGGGNRTWIAERGSGILRPSNREVLQAVWFDEVMVGWGVWLTRWIGRKR
jgi:hypothetical protein